MKCSALLLLLVSVAAPAAYAAPIAERESCATVADCLHGFPAPSSTLRCAASSVCEARNSRSCRSPRDCAAVLTTCVLGRCAPGLRGAPCYTRMDCAIGHYCSVAGVCERGKPGTKCSLGSAVQCVDGLTCSSHGVCTPGVYNSRCVLDRNCGADLYCDGGRCNIGEKRKIPKLFKWETTPPPLHSARPAVVPESSVESVPSLVSTNLDESSSTPLVTAIPPIEELRSENTSLVVIAEKPPLNLNDSIGVPAYVSEEPVAPTVEVRVFDSKIENEATASKPEVSAIPVIGSMVSDGNELGTVIPDRTSSEQEDEEAELIDPLTMRTEPTAISVPSTSAGSRKSPVIEVVIHMK